MNISIKFNESDSSKLYDDIINVNKKSFGHCHVADLYRLSKKIELYDETDSILERSTSIHDSYPKLLRIRDLICSLKVLLNENQSDILDTLQTFSSLTYIAKESKSGDEMKVLETILSYINKESMSFRLFKLIANQSVVFYPYILIKSKLERKFPLIDKNGFWDIDVKVYSDNVTISHIKTMKNKDVSDLVELVWRFTITYNSKDDKIEKCDLEIISIIFGEDVDESQKLRIIESIKREIE